MKIFITGGTGFVGKDLTFALIHEGHEVTILTRSAKRPEGSPAGASIVGVTPRKRVNGKKL